MVYAIKDIDGQFRGKGMSYREHYWSSIRHVKQAIRVQYLSSKSAVNGGEIIEYELVEKRRFRIKILPNNQIVYKDIDAIDGMSSPKPPQDIRFGK